MADKPTADELPTTPSTLECVQLDGHVVLTIVKHCQEAMPNVVTGLLLGLDVESTLEVTSCFPFALSTSSEEEADGDAYQIDMMKCLRLVNADCYTVGWYQSTHLSSFLNESMVEHQFSYQENLDKCVCIVYDPLLSTQGNFCLKAVRLTDDFMAVYRDHKQNQTPIRLSELESYEVYEEIPIRIHNSLLIEGALQQLTAQTQASPTHFDLLDFPSNQFLEKNLEFMAECIDELTTEHNKLQYHQRSVARQKAQQEAYLQKRKDEGSEATAEELAQNPLFKPIPEPSRLDALLASNQITNHCKQINDFAGQSLSKVFVVKALHKDD